NVTGEAKIDQITKRIQGTIVMPAYVAVGIEGLRHNRTGDVRIAVDGYVGARGVDAGRKIARRRDSNGLVGRGISWADAVYLKITGQAGLIDNVLSFHVDIAVDVNLEVDMG